MRQITELLGGQIITAQIIGAQLSRTLKTHANCLNKEEKQYCLVTTFMKSLNSSNVCCTQIVAASRLMLETFDNIPQCKLHPQQPGPSEVLPWEPGNFKVQELYNSFLLMKCRQSYCKGSKILRPLKLNTE